VTIKMSEVFLVRNGGENCEYIGHVSKVRS